jgi:hypothetical protein
VKSVTAADFVERVALTLAKVDECDFEKDPALQASCASGND